MVVLPASQERYRRLVGSLGSRPVYQIGGIGGIHVVAAGREILGMGTLGALARHVAKRAHPDIEFNDLEKSEAVDARAFPAGMVAEWEANTAEARRMQGFE